MAAILGYDAAVSCERVFKEALTSTVASNVANIVAFMMFLAIFIVNSPLQFPQINVIDAERREFRRVFFRHCFK